MGELLVKFESLLLREPFLAQLTLERVFRSFIHRRFHNMKSVRVCYQTAVAGELSSAKFAFKLLPSFGGGVSVHMLF